MPIPLKAVEPHNLLDLIPDESRADAEREIDQAQGYFAGGADMDDIIEELLALIGSDRLSEAWARWQAGDDDEVTL